MRALLLLPVVAWLPGALLFRLPLLSRERRAALAWDERLFWAIVLSVATSLSIVMVLAAAHRYSFGRLVGADVVLATALAAVARLDLRLGSAARGPGAAALVPIVLAALALWRFPPPSECIIGGKDPGVYVNAGVQIAQRGTLVYHDPVIAAVPPAARPLFMPRDKNRETYYVAPRFMGFFIRDPDTGAEVSQLPHLYPASIAIGYGLDGLTGARRVITFWGVLGVLAVYFLGARLFGRPAAAAAAGLLTLHMVQLWFARYPNADMTMQALLFASLLACARGHVDDDPFFAPVAGGLLGLQLFLRFDAVVAVAAAAGAVALGGIAGQRLRWTFFAPLVAAGALCLWYLTGPMREYFEMPRLFLMNLPTWEYDALAGGTLLVAALLVAGRRMPAVAASVTRAVPWLATIVVVALAVYALWLRHPGGKLTDYDAYALRTFAAFYLTLPALLAALIGYAVVVRPLFWRDPPFVVTLTAFALFFFYKIRIVPEHFWAARRFVPILLPGALLLAAAAALTGMRGRGLAGRALRPIGIVFLAVLATQYVRAAAPIAGHVEYEGIIARLEQLAARIGDDDLVVVEARNAGSDVHVLGLPLSMIYARNVLLLATPTPDKTAFAAFLEDARARYRRVLFLGGGGSDLLSPRWSLTPVASERFQVPEYESIWNAYPRGVHHKEFDYSLYVFGPPGPRDQPFTLDVGIDDDLNVIRFHAKETTAGGRTIRWSQRQSFVNIDHLRAGDRTLALWMSDGGRPPAAPPAVVQILAGARELGTVTVSGGFREYDVDIPADLAAAAAASGDPVRVTLRTATWNPRRVLGTPDDRELGVMLDRVAVR